MVSLKRAIVVMATSLGIVFVANPAAYASGSFTWTVHLKCCIDSRTWTQGSGSTKVYSALACEPNMGGHYQVTLWKEQLFDKSWGPVSYACGSNQVYTFTGLPSGNYHFHISKVDDGIYVNGNGSVVYP